MVLHGGRQVQQVVDIHGLVTGGRYLQTEGPGLPRPKAEAEPPGLDLGPSLHHGPICHLHAAPGDLNGGVGDVCVTEDLEASMGIMELGQLTASSPQVL